VRRMEWIHGRLEVFEYSQKNNGGTRTLTYSSQRSLKNTLIPSSFLVSWRMTNFMSIFHKKGRGR
jgi:hypothetical protein